jgi:hypothetical protein
MSTLKSVITIIKAKEIMALPELENFYGRLAAPPIQMSHLLIYLYLQNDVPFFTF